VDFDSTQTQQYDFFKKMFWVLEEKGYINRKKKFQQTLYRTGITSKQARLWRIQRVIICANEAEVRD